MVDSSGGMLDQSWEAYCESLANAAPADAAAALENVATAAASSDGGESLSSAKGGVVSTSMKCLWFTNHIGWVMGCTILLDCNFPVSFLGVVVKLHLFFCSCPAGFQRESFYC